MTESLHRITVDSSDQQRRLDRDDQGDEEAGERLHRSARKASLPG